MLIKDKLQSKRSQFFKKRGNNALKNSKILKLNNRFNNIKKNYFQLIIYESLTLRFKHFIKVRRLLKKIRRNGFNELEGKVWLKLPYNSIISKKSKNSRMGKGKGDFHSWAIRYKKYTIILKLFNILHYKITFYLAKRLSYLINSKISSCNSLLYSKTIEF